MWLAALLCGLALQSGQSAIYKEAGGRVVIEAEHFDSRTVNADGHRWQIIPDEIGNPNTPADAGFANARGGKYMQSQPDAAGGGTSYNTVDKVAIDPHLDFKVQISNPGSYRLWIRWGGYDGSSDSLFAQILELKSPSGPGPDWYRYVGNIAGDFDNSIAWNGSGAPSTDTANNVGGGGGEVPAVWNISTAGTYTIRLGMREDGSAVDALVLQLASMAPPAGQGPAESDTTTSVDTTKPVLVDALTMGNPNGFFVIFSEQVSRATATNIANYALDNGVTVTGVTGGPNNYTYRVATTPIAPGKQYTLTVNNIQDVAATPNTIAANSKVSFYQVDGVIERRVFLDITGTATANLTNAPAFIANQPNEVTYPDSLEGPTSGALPDNYGTQFRGYVTAPLTGNYVFFISADDNADLFLSTDENPANKKLIAQEQGWSTARNWQSANGGDASQKRSDTFGASQWPTPNVIKLTAGSRYYIEVLHKEGGGGDDVGVAWMLPGAAAEPAAGDPPIPGKYLSAFGASGNITITKQPVSVTAQEPGSATFSVEASGSPPYIVQWLKNGSPILGATSTTYTLPQARSADNGAKISVRVSNAFSTALSSDAILTVIPDTKAPLPFQVTSVGANFKTVTLSFNEMLDKTSAQTGLNFVFGPGNITATNVVLDATGTNVTITTPTALTAGVTNTLTISGVKDISGNAVSGGTTIQFTFTPVTYAQNILFDQPIAYYRFEEPAGATVATNSGTARATSGDGVYNNDNGTPAAHADPGPRPPAFAGFDPANRAATFDGAGEWVDTQASYLEGLGAFSLEYWVAPAQRATQGTRIGIVGQNDAIEYGFIDPNTIQIWTPNGGSLNTAYSFPDNEWHHVATIADGKTIKTYYDGNLIGTGGSATTNYGNAAFTVHIAGGGVFDASGNYFPGKIDEVAIFNKAIPAARIAAHYKAGKEGGVLVTSGAVGSGSAPLKITSVTSAGNSVKIAWTGGTPPYLVQKKASLAAANWFNVMTSTDTSATVFNDGKAGFFRISDQAAITVIPLTAILSPAAERPNPVTNSSASGGGTFSLEGTNLSFMVSYQGLTGIATAAHIHGITNAASAAPVIISMIPFAVGGLSSNGTFSGTVGLTDQQRTGLLAGLTYFNIHTALNPGGEMRGQIEPVQLQATLNGANEKPNAVNTTATGAAKLSLTGNQLTFNVTYSGLTGTATAAHIHGPANATATASPIINLVPFSVGPLGTSGSFAGTVTLTPDQLAMIIDGLTYANVHTAANGGGEIRGQITP